jgi:nitrite reductase/ring-hydroxylating ferredoxin subunit
MPMLLRVAHVDDVPVGACRQVKVRGTKILVAHSPDGFHAIGAKCPHMGLPLASGDFDGTTVTCRFHGARVDVRTGRLVAPPSRSEWARGSLGRRVAAFLGRAKRAKEGCGRYRAEVRGSHVFVAVDPDRESAPASVQANDRDPLVVGR